MHLLASKEKVIANVYKILKAGGMFVTSTVCPGDSMKFFKLLAQIGKFPGLMPLVNIVAENELENSLTDASFKIDCHWQLGKGKAVFIVAKMAEQDQFLSDASSLYASMLAGFPRPE